MNRPSNIVFQSTKTFIRVANVWQLVIKRSLANWRLLSSVVLGVVLASSLMSGTIIYFDALRETALKTTLESTLDTKLDIVLESTRGPTIVSEYAQLHEAAVSEINKRVAWMLKGSVRAGRSPTMFLTKPGSEQEAGKDSNRTYFVFLDEIENNIEIIQWGRMPTSKPQHDAGSPPMVEAIIPIEAADLFGVEVGDNLVAVPTWTDDAPYVNVVISGLFTKSGAQSEFWHLNSVMSTATSKEFNTIPFYITESAFLNVVGPPLLKMDSTYYYLLDVDEHLLNANNANLAAQSISDLGAFLSTTLSQYLQVTVLDDVIRRYDRRLFFSKLPMFMVLVLISIVVLYYVATLSSLVVESQRGELILLRSRGANSTQILVVFILEGLTIAVFSTIVSPLIAAGSISLLGTTPAFSDLTGGEFLNISLSLRSFLIGGIGGILGLVALVLPAITASRIEVIRNRQEMGRPSSKPFLQRYYIDILLLIVSIYLFNRLTEQGSVVATSFLGESMVNELIMILPGITLIAAAIILLRIFPVVMNLAVTLLSSRLSAGMVMGIWQIARSPTHYARLSLLLILTAGLGIFASSFGATLERSFRDRVMHSSGTDIRIEGIQGREITNYGPQTLSSTYSGVPGIEFATAVLRKRGQDLSKLIGVDYDMFGIDPELFADVAFFRNDYTENDVRSLLEKLSTPTIIGVDIPRDANSLFMRVKPDRHHPGIRVTAQIRHPDGSYNLASFGSLNSDDWINLKAEFRQSSGTNQDKVSSLVSIRIHETDPFNSLQAGSLQIDEIGIETDSGKKIILDSFETLQWKALISTAEAVSDTVRPATDFLPGESGSVIFKWSDGASQTIRGFFRGIEYPSIPVLASQAFIQDTGHSQGDQFEVLVASSRVPVHIVGTINLFPTVTSPDKRYLVSDIDALISYVNLGTFGDTLIANQVWIKSSLSGPERTHLIENIRNIGGPVTRLYDRTKNLEETRIDPLVNAGWRSLLFLSFGAVLILSCIGFLVHAYMSYKSRLVQLALMRTIGVSVSQLTTMVWIEQALVVSVGMLLGSWMGARLGTIIMPFLGHDDWGDKVVPPFITDVNWTALLATYGLMLLIFGIITLGLVWLIHKISVHSVLRLGDT